MALCPACRHDLGGNSTECPHCGVILAKFRADRPKVPPPAHTARRIARQHESRKNTPLPPVVRVALILVLGVGGGLAVTGGYWYARIRPRMGGGGWVARPSRAQEVRAGSGTISGADRSVRLPAEPYGLAWDGKRFLSCSRVDPWGFVSAVPSGEGFEVRQIPVIEERYNQKVGLGGVTWNGSQFVGYATEAWFVDGSTGNVFTVHDPGTLQIVRTVRAPDNLGALAWDGSGYWAATRSNTEDSGETPALYRLDADFNVVSTLASPGAGIQGLAWDGTSLWAVDVFSDTLYRLDVSGGQAQVLGSWPVSAGYLSGVAWDGKSLWLVEYEESGLHRVDLAALGVAPAFGGGPAESASGATHAEGAADPAAVAALREDLWSDDSGTRTRAEFELDRLGAPARRAREVESFPDVGPEDTDLLDFRAEIVDGTLRASWKAFLGKDLFNDSPQQGMVTVNPIHKYQVSVKGGTLPQEIEAEYEAAPGENAMEDVVLAQGLGPGEYSVSFFIWVQYTDRSGQGRILNNNAGTLWIRN